METDGYSAVLWQALGFLWITDPPEPGRWPSGPHFTDEDAEAQSREVPECLRAVLLQAEALAFLGKGAELRQQTLWTEQAWCLPAVKLWRPGWEAFWSRRNPQMGAGVHMPSAVSFWPPCLPGLRPGDQWSGCSSRRPRPPVQVAAGRRGRFSPDVGRRGQEARCQAGAGCLV